MIVSGNECGTNEKGFWVYFGFRGQKLVYIGTTMQKPSDRFRWHRHNGKPLRFEVAGKYKTADEMLDGEIKLIKKHQPKLNKKKTKHNDNRKLGEAEIEARKGSSSWCQCCLKRRVNAGYSKCYFC